jgi:A/G-specific adenine glycosylase
MHPPLVAIPAKELPAFRRQLLDWFRAAQRDLDWRHTRDPYRIWISEIMLQQTRVAAVIPYYRRFCARFPSVRRLARAPVDDVLRHWAGLGYYRRARHLHRAAKQIVRRHGARFPRALAEALALPGIGRYTASAVLSIAYNEPLAVVDGNVARVLARLGAVRTELRRPAAKGRPSMWRRLEDTAGYLLPPATPGDWNQAMMELGATICTPRAPRCTECPVARWCRAHALGIAARLPATRKPPPAVRMTLAAAVLLDPRGRTLVVRQQDGTLFSRLWQFPAVAAPRNPRANIARHLEREFGVPISGLEPVATARHAVTFHDIRLAPFVARLDRLPRVSGARTPKLCELDRVPVSSATRKIAAAALAALQPAPNCRDNPGSAVPKTL